MNRIRFCLLLSVVLWHLQALGGNPLDISSLNNSQIRSYLKPYLTCLVSELLPPGGFFINLNKPIVVLGIKENVIHLVKGDYVASLPSFWLLTNIGPGVCVVGALQSGNWENNIYNSMALLGGYNLGSEQEPVMAIIELLHTKGFDDFHFRNIGIGLEKNWRYESGFIGAGFYYNLTQCKIHISDRLLPATNYYAIKEQSIPIFQLNIVKDFKNNFGVGSEVLISRKSISFGVHSFFTF